MSKTHHKNTTQKQPISAYVEMHRAIRQAYGWRFWLIISISEILGIVSALLTFAVSKPQQLTDIDLIAWVLTSLILGFATLPLLLIVIQNLNPSDKEAKLIEAGLQFLKSRAFSASTIEAIEKRAGAAQTAGGVRTLLPILVLSLTWPYILTANALAAILLFPLAMVAMLMIVAFTIEIDRANIDSVIVQACIEFGSDS